MKVSILIPVFNEEKTVAELLQKVANVSLPDSTKEIIIINDGSTDASVLEITKSHAKLVSQKKKSKKILEDIIILHHKKNQGKGMAIRTGLQKATGDYIVIQDADLEYDPKQLKKLFAPIKKGGKTVVYGTRLQRLPNFSRDERNLLFLLHYFGNKLLSLLTSMLYLQWITDMETCYKVFPKNALKGVVLRAKSFDFEPEITAKLLKKGYRITEIPITTIPRGYTDGKKIHAGKDGMIALWTLVKYRFVD